MVSMKQEEIFQLIFSVMDRIRGFVDCEEYKDIILPLLFYKHISDVWIKNKDEETGKNEIKETIKISDNNSFYDIFAKIEKDNKVRILEKALLLIEKDNPDVLKGVFEYTILEGLRRSRDSQIETEAIIGAIEIINQIDLKHDYVNQKEHVSIGEVFENALNIFASISRFGEFMTPIEISHLFSEIIKPKKGDQIYDPAIGTGSLLLRVLDHKRTRNFEIFGQEVNKRNWALCKMNMIIHGHLDANIALGNTLLNPQFLQGDSIQKFDIVISNPPFSVKNWNYEHLQKDPYNRYKRGIPPGSNADYAFISHMIESLKEKQGRMGILVSHGVLFKRRKEGEIRRKIVEENLIEAVIGLPEKMLYGTSIPVAIVILKKQKEDTDILFIDASKGFEEGKSLNTLRVQDIKRIASTYTEKKEIENYSRIVKIEEIITNEYNLNIRRYVDSSEIKEKIDIKWAIKEIEQLEYELNQTRNRTTELIKELYKIIKERE